MGKKIGFFVVLVLIVAAMLVGTKRYTDSRYRASQDALVAESDYCTTLRHAGGPTTASDRERCEQLWSRDGDRNHSDELVAKLLYGLTALIALIGVVLILRLGRRASAET